MQRWLTLQIVFLLLLFGMTTAHAENWVRVFHDEGGYVGTMSLSLDADRISTQPTYKEFPVRQTMLGETEEIRVRANCSNGEFQQVTMQGKAISEWESPYDSGYQQLIEHVCKPETSEN